MTQAIDMKQLEELLDSMGGDWSFIGELLDAFYADAPAQFETLRTALAGGDADSVRRAAHTIKSNARSFGATRLTELSKTLEDAGRDGNLSQAQALIDQMQAEYETVRTELEKIRTQG